MLGELTVDIRTLMLSSKQLIHNESLSINDTVTGAINFDTVKGKNDKYVFQDAMSPWKVNRSRIRNFDPPAKTIQSSEKSIVGMQRKKVSINVSSDFSNAGGN